MNPKLTRLAELEATENSEPMERAAITELEAALVDALRAIRLTQASSADWERARTAFYSLTAGRVPPRAPHAVNLAKATRKWLFTPTTTAPRSPERRIENELHDALLKFLTGEGLGTPHELDALANISKTTRDWPKP